MALVSVNINIYGYKKRKKNLSRLTSFLNSYRSEKNIFQKLWYSKWSLKLFNLIFRTKHEYSSIKHTCNYLKKNIHICDILI